MMIRPAERKDLSRIAEIFIFNNRINYYPIFKDPHYSFGELQVLSMIQDYEEDVERRRNTWVFEEDELILGFIEVRETEIVRLYVDPFFQNKGIGDQLIEFAIEHFHSDHLYALEKNTRALSFYARHGFMPSTARIHEEDTEEFLVKLKRTTTK